MHYDNMSPLSVIGVGPGDPELLSLKALRLIKSAQVIFAPCSARKKDSLALEIIKGALADEELKAEIVNQVYPMSRDQEELKSFWEKAAKEVEEKLSQGKKGVFITLGDPSLYSTWSYLQPRLTKRSIPYEIVPGTPSFCLGAAKTRRELAIGEERLAVIPMPADRVEFEELMERFDTLVLMKIGRAMGCLKKILTESGYLDRAWIISRCGLPEEQILPMGELVDESIGYLSHVIVYKKSESGESIK